MTGNPQTFITTRSELRSRGVSDRRIAEAVSAGRLARLRRGWYAVPGVPSALHSAVAAGGRLGCVSALAWHGVWTLQRATHVCIPRGAHRAPTPQVTHWRRMQRLSPATIVEPAAEAFDQFSRCGTDREIVVAADSALHCGVLSESDVAEVLGRTRRGRRLLSRVDSRAESGTETLMRLGLRARGIRVRSQVTIPGVGRVDFVIGDRLVVEVDGRTWHDTESTFESDRRRDAALVALGYIVMRFSYRRVMDELDAAVGEILAVIHRREHRWRARHWGTSG
jgi:very-short-patch-repair endonuclease